MPKETGGRDRNASARTLLFQGTQTLQVPSALPFFTGRQSLSPQDKQASNQESGQGNDGRNRTRRRGLITEYVVGSGVWVGDSIISGFCVPVFSGAGFCVTVFAGTAVTDFRAVGVVPGTVVRGTEEDVADVEKAYTVSSPVAMTSEPSALIAIWRM